MDSLGKLVKKYRVKKGHDLKQMARRCKISESFAGHVENSRQVPISPRIIAVLGQIYRIPKTKLQRAAKTRYRIGSDYYRRRLRALKKRSAQISK